jgi:hypothetical protein
VLLRFASTSFNYQKLEKQCSEAENFLLTTENGRDITEITMVIRTVVLAMTRSVLGEVINYFSDDDSLSMKKSNDAHQ